PAVQQIVKEERDLFVARRTRLAGEVSMLRERIKELNTQIGGFRAQKAAQQAQLALIKDELAGLRTLYEKGYVPKPRILALEREAARLEGEGGELDANMARGREAIAQAEI